MTASGEEKEFVFYVVELMQSIGPVRARAMFGGHGIFLEQPMSFIVSGTAV
ncbi:MAG: TfoX/Sxy family protein [Gammaproteobacteria bacterium]